MRQVVKVFNPIDVYRHFETQQINAPLKNQYLKKFAYWLAKKVGVIGFRKATETSIGFETFVIDYDHVFDQLQDHLSDVKQHSSDFPDTLLCGPKFLFQAEASLFLSTQKYSLGQVKLGEALGLKVVVIPWMEGFLLVDSKSICKGDS